jgi:hypothetical protein
MGKTTNDMFLTAKQKASNDFELAKKMIDSVDGTLRNGRVRIDRINECWNLHSGKWPEMEDYLGRDTIVIREKDGSGKTMNLNDYIVHHGKVNNVTQYIMGDIIMQPLIAIVKDFSAFGRKYREDEKLRKAKSYYYENFYAPNAELIRYQYFQEMGITDIMALNPDEQRQVQLDLQKRLKASIPRSVIDDLKKIRTPDEKIRQVLLEYDIKAYDIEEKFQLGGEQAVVAYEEYYKIGRIGVKPTLQVLNSKWVTWAGSENCDYAEDGVMAKYEEFLTPHDFIMKYGRQVIQKKDFLKDVETYFQEIPGYFRDSYSKKHGDNLFVEEERDFVDAIGANPGLIKNDWRTLAGQQEIAALYNALSSRHSSGYGIRDVYTVFKWTESMTYVQRKEKDDRGKEVVKEYFFSADYEKDKTKDILVRKFPVNRVYHGSKISDRFYVGVEPVPWQYFGGVYDFEPKLTICGRRYSKSNGNDEDTTLIGPAIQYQLRYNVTASKLEDLEKSDIGKIMLWNTNMKPTEWSEEEYIAMMLKARNVPYTKHQSGNDGDSKPFYVEDAGSSAQMKEYRDSMDMWEREIYKAMRVNMDSLGQANQYQSNALTQSNIQGSAKQLLPFHNKRRLVKQRVLNYFSNLSMICLLDDHEKQAILFDDFSRMHLIVNADDIRGQGTSLFIVDDYSEAQDVERIRQQILTMLQQGTSIADVIALMRSKSTAAMQEIAEVAELKARDDAKEAQEYRMAEIQANNKFLQDLEAAKQAREDARIERENQVRLQLEDLRNDVMYNAADVDRNNQADSLQKAKEEIKSREKIAEQDRQSKEKIESGKRTNERIKISADASKKPTPTR